MDLPSRLLALLKDILSTPFVQKTVSVALIPYDLATSRTARKAYVGTVLLVLAGVFLLAVS
ncbi:MAG: hypothetical protein Q9202_002476, partial [Teloschistes flavicans]